MSGVYVDGLVLAVLRPAVAPVVVYSEEPADLTTRVKTNPVVVVSHLGGGAVDPRFDSTRAIVQLDTYATGKRAAFDTARACQVALLAAWAAQTVTPDGWIASLTSQADPSELRLADQPSGITRYVSTLVLLCRA